MVKKIGSYYFLLLCFAVYDILIKRSEGFPVNLVIFFYVSFYGFVLFRMFIDMKEAKLKLDRWIIISLSTVFIGRIWLNLAAIGETREGYNMLVSNQIIDITQWVILVGLMIVILWQNGTR